MVREGAVTPPPPLISVTRCLVCSHTAAVAAARVAAVVAIVAIVATLCGDLELLLEHLCRYHRHQSIVIITLQLKPCNQPQTLSPSQIAPPQDR